MLTLGFALCNIAVYLQVVVQHGLQIDRLQVLPTTPVDDVGYRQALARPGIGHVPMLRHLKRLHERQVAFGIFIDLLVDDVRERR